MWEQYKKTFLRMQIAIWLVVAGVLVFTRSLGGAATFLTTMQVGAIWGSVWGARLGKVSRGPSAGSLPARRA
jgi:hypothetical protein